MKIIELPQFVRDVEGLLDDLDQWRLQDFLVANPEAGNLIKGGKGLRKLRWKLSGALRGKSGGMRVIYYYFVQRAVVFVTAYAKSKKENLTADELKALARELEDLKP